MSDKVKHTPEPWSLRKFTESRTVIQVRDKRDLTIATLINASNAEVQENAMRIVECVNAMAGIEYPRLWMNELLEESRGNDAKKTIRILRAERYELLNALEVALEHINNIQEKYKPGVPFATGMYKQVIDRMKGGSNG